MANGDTELMELATLAAGYLAGTTYLSLATVDDSLNPWVSPLYYSTTPKLEILWISAAECRHSDNLSGNPRVAICCYDSAAPFGTGQGVYLEGLARVLRSAELEESCRAFYARRFRDEETLREKARGPVDFLAPSPRRMYKAEILRAWVLAPEGHPKYGPLVDERTEIPLDLLRSAYRPPSPPEE